MKTDTPDKDTTPSDTLKKKLSRASCWLLSNALFLALMWMAFAKNIDGAKNVLLLLVWGTLIVYTMALVVVSMRDKLAKDPLKELVVGRRGVWRWLDDMLYIGISFTFVWHGWFFSGIVILFAACVKAVAYYEATKPHKPVADAV